MPIFSFGGGLVDRQLWSGDSSLVSADHPPHRLRHSVPLIAIGAAVCARWGPAGTWLWVAGLGLLHVVGVLVCSWISRRRGRPTLVASNVLNVLLITGGLAALGELFGPLTGLYILCILPTTLLAGLRIGIVTALSAIGSYAAALLLTQQGVLPAMPSVLSGSTPIAAAVLFLTFVAAGSVLMTDILGGLTIAAAQRRHAAALEREVARRTRELEDAYEDLRVAQDRLIEAQNLEYAEALGGRIAHVLNNPLTALIGTAEIVARSGEPLAKRTYELARRLQSLVERMLGFNRQAKVSLAWTDTQSLLEEVSHTLQDRAKSQDVKITLGVAADASQIWVDRTMLATALVCVAENSLQAMPTGGNLTLEALWHDAAELVELRVTDTGPGIPAELRLKIVEPFYTTRSRGTGLGLPIAQGIVRGHRGRLEIADAPDRGAAVSILIPGLADH